MKTKFKISPRFPVKPELAKQVARFCIQHAVPVCRKLGKKVPASVSFTMFGSPRQTRSGRAVRNCNRIIAQNTSVFLRLGQYAGGIHVERYHRYADSPVCPCDGQTEIYLHLVAHEVGHAVCGFNGQKEGEFACENFARHCVEEYRMATQDPACLI